MAAVELAILSPFFGIVIIGMFELTRVIMVKQGFDDAARTACRSGILPGHGTKFPTTSSTGSNISQDVINILSDMGLDPTRATITVTVSGSTATVYSVSGSSGNYIANQTSGSGADPLTASSGTNISVKVSMQASDILWLASKYVPGTTIESDFSTMAKQ